MTDMTSQEIHEVIDRVLKATVARFDKSFSEISVPKKSKMAKIPQPIRPGLDLYIASARLHHHFLDVIQLELDRLKIKDLNSVRALILFNIGEAEITVSELIYRGCYLGTNVSYNLKKLTESGYIEQFRSSHDRRVVMVRTSAKGLAICAALVEMTARDEFFMKEEKLQPESLAACLSTLNTLQRFWARKIERRSDNGLQKVA